MIPPEDSAAARPPVRVCLVEDDSALRESLSLLVGGSPGFLVAGAYPRAELALRAIPDDRPDVVLMDIKMPKMSGVECVRRLVRLLPGVKVLMLTTHEDEDLLFDSLRAGAVGYLLKRTPPAELLGAIADARDGASPLTGKMARLLVGHIQRGETSNRPGTGAVDSTTAPLPPVSEREREVLELLSAGLRNKEIAARLSVSDNTVRAHLRNIYEKLQVDSRAEAVARFVQGGG